jgi:hypothetical protein
MHNSCSSGGGLHIRSLGPLPFPAFSPEGAGEVHSAWDDGRPNVVEDFFFFWDGSYFADEAVGSNPLLLCPSHSSSSSSFMSFCIFTSWDKL